MLTDPRSEKVKGISRLNQKDARYETGLFLLEGFQGLREIVDYPDLIEEILVTEPALSEHSELFASVQSKVTLVSDRVLDKIADTRTPQGVVTVAHQLDVDIELVISNKPKLVAVLDQIRDPGNAGTVLRAADAAGADAVIFSKESVDLYNPKTVRSTAGSLFHLPIVIEADIDHALAQLHEAGLQILAAAGMGESILGIDSLAEPTAWVFGNEAHGVTDRTLELADKVVALPIFGAAESLNLATAASVCLYQSAFRQNPSR